MAYKGYLNDPLYQPRRTVYTLSIVGRARCQVCRRKAVKSRHWPDFMGGGIDVLCQSCLNGDPTPKQLVEMKRVEEERQRKLRAESAKRAARYKAKKAAKAAHLRYQATDVGYWSDVPVFMGRLN